MKNTPNQLRNIANGMDRIKQSAYLGKLNMLSGGYTKSSIFKVLLIKNNL